MFKDLLSSIINPGSVEILEVPEFTEDKPDYTPLIGGVVALLVVLAVFYFIVSKK